MKISKERMILSLFMSAGKFVGKMLAQIQDLFDSLFGWGFTKLKQQAEKPHVENPDDKLAGVKNVARKTADFIGTAGTEYYEEYERLKQKKREEKK